VEHGYFAGNLVGVSFVIALQIASDHEYHYRMELVIKKYTQNCIGKVHSKDVQKE
jgi:predicted HicB family RNase H-like nuclease